MKSTGWVKNDDLGRLESRCKIEMEMEDGDQEEGNVVGRCLVSRGGGGRGLD